jgi:hypothetical protein
MFVTPHRQTARPEGSRRRTEGGVAGRTASGAPLRGFHLLPAAFLLGLAAVAVMAAAAKPAQQGGARPAIWIDNDTSSIPEPARKFETLRYDFFYATFGQAPRSFVRRTAQRPPAWNANAWDEAPDSSWYTNRNHLHPMTPQEVARGPNQGSGPDLSDRLLVLEGKTVGTSFGFGRTRDSAGNTYFIKFDSAEYPELSTASEVIVSRFFHALGFTVPQQWIVHVRPEQIELDPKATIWDKNGRQRKMTPADVAEVLKTSARLPDGRYRAVASLLLSGRNKGGFLFHGTRRDDPNDLIPHEHRRELRGLRLLSAWLNHYDIRPGNTLDMFVDEEGRKFLRHCLLDFGSALGSASYFPKVPRMGFSYVWDTREMSGPFLTLGLYQPRWREHPAPVQYPSVGRFQSAMFSPHLWKPVLPLIAFDYMDNSDAFWAAKLVMAFTEQQIRATVREGQLSDPQAEEALVRTLLERQRKVGRYGFTATGPLDQFHITESGGQQRLDFEDLAIKYGFASPDGTFYLHVLRAAGDNTFLGRPRSFRGRSLPLTEPLKWTGQAGQPRSLYVLSLCARRRERGFSDKWVHVYLQREGRGFRLCGWERDGK